MLKCATQECLIHILCRATKKVCNKNLQTFFDYECTVISGNSFLLCQTLNYIVLGYNMVIAAIVFCQYGTAFFCN